MRAFGRSNISRYGLFLAITLIQVVSIVAFKNYSFDNITLFVMLTLIRFLNFSHLRRLDFKGLLSLNLYLEASLNFTVLFIYFYDLKYSLKVFSLGYTALLYFYILYYSVLLFFRKSSRDTWETYPEVLNLNLKKIYFLLVFISTLTSIISFKLGITIMGAQSPQLPFKLEPALNLLREIIIPCCFIYVLDIACSKKRKKLKVTTAVSFVLWTLLESYIRGSRGILFLNCILLIMFSVKYIPFKTVSLTLLLLLISSPLIYFSGDYFRSSHVVHDFNGQKFNFNNIFYDGYDRLFHDLQLFNKFIVKEDSKLFSLNIKKIQSHGGSVKYHTEIYDKTNFNTNSSGITALSDGLLYFGYSGVFYTLTIVFCMFLANDLKVFYFSKIWSINTLITFSLLKIMIWGDGFWGFYLNRSIFTILVFPSFVLTVSFIHWKLKKRDLK